MYCDNWDTLPPLDAEFPTIIVKDVEICKTCENCEDGFCMEAGYIMIFDYFY